MKNKFLAMGLCLLLGLSTTACSPKSAEPLGPQLPDTDDTVFVPDDGLPDDSLPILPEEPSEPDPETPSTPPTVTPEPEPPITMPEPEPEPEPVPQTDDLLVSTANSLNIRSGAGTAYASVGTLDKSDMAMPVRKVGNWYEIYYKNTRGYVSASYVTQKSFVKASDAVENVIDEGKKLLGLPYVFGAQRYHWGNGVRNTNYDGKSYDCSSLMQYIFKIGANVNLAMTSREQSVQGTAVSKNNIRRGDLLFFTNASRFNKTGVERIGHVALYLGDNIILHTASDHAVIEPISDTRWSYYITARRVL